MRDPYGGMCRVYRAAGSDPIRKGWGGGLGRGRGAGGTLQNGADPGRRCTCPGVGRRWGRGSWRRGRRCVCAPRGCNGGGGSATSCGGGRGGTIQKGRGGERDRGTGAGRDCEGVREVRSG